MGLKNWVARPFVCRAHTDNMRAMHLHVRLVLDVCLCACATTWHVVMHLCTCTGACMHLGEFVCKHAHLWRVAGVARMPACCLIQVVIPHMRVTFPTRAFARTCAKGWPRVWHVSFVGLQGRIVSSRPFLRLRLWSHYSTTLVPKDWMCFETSWPHFLQLLLVVVEFGFLVVQVHPEH